MTDTLDIMFPPVETIKIKYLPGAAHMEQVDKGGCIDAYTYEEVVCHAGEHVLFNLGFACQLPEGYDAELIPCRSSTMRRYGLLGIPGYIDNEYNGPDDLWYASCIATRDVIIPAGTRAFQWRLVKVQPKIQFEEDDLMHNENRKGFGEGTGI